MRTARPSSLPQRKRALALAAAACTALAAAPRAAQAQLNAQSSLQWLSFLRHAGIASSAANPGNLPFRIPETELLSELRPALKLSLPPGISLVARPILRAAGYVAKTGAEGRRESFWSDAYFNELYGNLVFGAEEELSVSYGIQNLQWGPAELTSPSNPVFREASTEREYFLLTRGRLLWRAHLSFGKDLALTALGETGALAPPVGKAQEPFPFEPKAALKLEWSGASGTAQLALIGALRAQSRPFAGAFGRCELADGLSLYGDAGAAYGTKVWYPTLAPGQASGRFARSKDRSAFRNIEAVLGLRYAFERGTDLRAEFYAQEAGWSEAELQDAIRVSASPSPERGSSLLAYAAPGTVLPGRRYLYLSLREPQIPLFVSSELSLRGLYSLSDGSARAFAVMESNVTDAAQLFIASAASFGRPDRELTRDARWSLTLGQRLSW